MGADLGAEDGGKDLAGEGVGGGGRGEDEASVRGVAAVDLAGGLAAAVHVHGLDGALRGSKASVIDCYFH